MSTTLTFFTTLNCGIRRGVLYERDSNGNDQVYDLTGATDVDLEIYTPDGTVIATIIGTIDDAENGVFTAVSDSSTFTDVEPGEYNYRVVVKDINNVDGRPFYLNAENRQLTCEVI